jgi:3',5'-cyclic AMP phosphodiesterase CpdA
MVRFAHVSDVHVSAQPLGWRFRDCFNKRATTWMNLRFGRGKGFRRAKEVLRALDRDRRERGLDYVVFSGDATALGYPNEIAQAAELLGVGRGPGIAVPGNHDYLTRAAALSGEFERRFAPWQQGERVDRHLYPFAQKRDDVWFVAVNSARGNRWFWDATGAVGHEQAERLRQLLSQLTPGPRVLVTHYPICLKNGHPEGRSHGLVDLATVLGIARSGGVRLWLHGHRHGFYAIPNAADAGFPALCCGSGTQENCWSYADCRMEAEELTGVRRVYDPARDQFLDGESLFLSLDA